MSDRTPPGDDLDRLLDEVAAELGDWTEEVPPVPGQLVSFVARKLQQAEQGDSPGSGYDRNNYHDRSNQ